jgi:AAA domain/DnaB-like helicase N terminal domain
MRSSTFDNMINGKMLRIFENHAGVPNPESNNSVPIGPGLNTQRPEPTTEFEKALLGCLLLEPEGIKDAINSGITHVMFDDLRCSRLFGLLVQMHKAGEPMDIRIIGRRLRYILPHQDYVSIATLLNELQDSAPSGSNAPYYFQPIKDAYQRLSIWRLGENIRSKVSDPQIPLEEVRMDAENLFRNVFADIGNGFPQMVDAAVFVTQPVEEPKQVVHGILHQGSKMVLGGGSKGYKSWTMIHLSLSVGHGVAWLNCPTTEGKVLHVNLEIQPFAFKLRVKAVASAMGITINDDAIQILNLRGQITHYEELLQRIQYECRGKGFTLIVIDPIYKLYGNADENSASDMAGLLNGLEKLATETGAAVACACHFSKGNQAGKESIDRVSGSGVFARDPDTLLMMTKHEEEGAFTVEAILRNFPPKVPFVVRWKPPLMQLDSALDPKKLKKSAGRKKTHTADKILTLLEPKPMTTGEWEKAALCELAIPHASFHRLLGELKCQHRISRSETTGEWCAETRPGNAH